MKSHPLCEVLDINEVIEKYRNMVYAIAMTHVNNRHDADDIFQDVFLAYYRNSKKFNCEEHRKAWLIRTTLNYCKKIIGSTWRKKVVPFASAEESTVEFDLEEENLVYSTLSELPLKYRTVINLFYFEDMKIEEISRTLGRKPGTVRVQLNRGREMMRKKLKGDYFYE